MKKKETILETIELLKSTSQFINDSRAALCAPYGLSHPQAILLLDIYHHPNPIFNRLTDEEFESLRKSLVILNGVCGLS